MRVTFFDRTGSEALEVNYEGPGIEEQTVPASAVFRVKAETQ